MESWELVENPQNRIKSDESDSEYDIGSAFSSDDSVLYDDIDEPVCSEPFTLFLPKSEKDEKSSLEIVEYKKIPFLETLSENPTTIFIEKERVDAISICILALLKEMELKKSAEENSQTVTNKKKEFEVSSTRETTEEISSKVSNVYDQKMHPESFANACHKPQIDEVSCHCISPKILEHALENTSAAVAGKFGSFLDEDGVLDNADDFCRSFIDKVFTYEFESTIQLNPSETIGTFKNSANMLLNKVDGFLDTADDALMNFLG